MKPKTSLPCLQEPALHLTESDKSRAPYAILRLQDTIKFLATANSRNKHAHACSIQINIKKQLSLNFGCLDFAVTVCRFSFYPPREKAEDNSVQNMVGSILQYLYPYWQLAVHNTYCPLILGSVALLLDGVINRGQVELFCPLMCNSSLKSLHFANKHSHNSAVGPTVCYVS